MSNPTTLAHTVEYQYDLLQSALILTTLVLWVLLWCRRYSANVQAGHPSVHVTVPLANQVGGALLLFLPALLGWSTTRKTKARKKRQ